MEKERESKTMSSSMNKPASSDDSINLCYRMKEALTNERNDADKDCDEPSISASTDSTSSSSCKLREVNFNSLQDEYNELLCKSLYSSVK